MLLCHVYSYVTEPLAGTLWSCNVTGTGIKQTA